MASGPLRAIGALAVGLAAAVNGGLNLAVASGGPGTGNGVVLLQVQDLAARIGQLKDAGLRFRNEMEGGPGGKQIQLEDPDGNPIELFEPA